MQLLLHPLTVWALKPPSWALVHKIIYAPMGGLYSPVHNVLDACITITLASGRGLDPGNLKLFGPQMALPYQLDAILQGPKNSRFLETNPLPLALVMDMLAFKTLFTGLYIA
jgi:hypothetical protein